MGEWWRLPHEQNSSYRAPPCEELNPPYDIKLVFVQKITFVVRKINKNCCHQSCTFSLQYTPNRLLAGASPQTPLGELTALPQPLVVFRGLRLKGGERRGCEGSSYEEKIKVGAYAPQGCSPKKEVGGRLKQDLDKDFF